MPPAPRLPARSEKRSPRTLEKGNGGSSEPPAFKSIWHLRGDDRQDKTSAATAAKTRLERCRSSTRRRSSVTPATPTTPRVMIKLAANGGKLQPEIKHITPSSPRKAGTHMWTAPVPQEFFRRS